MPHTVLSIRFLDMIKGTIYNIKLFAVFIIAMYMLYSGMMKLVGYPGMEESFMAWGYSYWFMITIGIVEIILAIAVFAKPTRNAAFLGLILLTTGALYTHISNYEYEEISIALWILISSIVMLGINLTKLEDKL